MNFTPDDVFVTLNCLCTADDRATVISDGNTWWTSRTGGNPPYLEEDLVSQPCAPPGETVPTHFICVCSYVSWDFVRDIQAAAANLGTPVDLVVDFYSDFMSSRNLSLLDEKAHETYILDESNLRQGLYERRRTSKLAKARDALRRRGGRR